jgi:hypothetical protein
MQVPRDRGTPPWGRPIHTKSASPPQRSPTSCAVRPPSLFSLLSSPDLLFDFQCLTRGHFLRTLTPTHSYTPSPAAFFLTTMHQLDLSK